MICVPTKPALPAETTLGGVNLPAGSHPHGFGANLQVAAGAWLDQRGQARAQGQRVLLLGGMVCIRPALPEDEATDPAGAVIGLQQIASQEAGEGSVVGQ